MTYNLKEVINKYNIEPRKSLGQNFILDENILDDIASRIDLKNDLVIEIGPGPGGLTKSILKRNPKKLIAIEKDERAAKALLDLAKDFPGKLEIIQADALSFDFTKIDERFHLVGNLPYNIATKILLNSYGYLQKVISILFMFQKEVALRIAASENSNNYGRLSVISQILNECSILYDLPPEVFWPKPKIDSSLILLKPRTSPAYNADIKKIENITSIIFGQRRKMLRTILKNKIREDIFLSIDIDLTKRAEELSIEEICRLSEVI